MQQDLLGVTTVIQQKYLVWHGLTFATTDLLAFVSLAILAYTAVQAFKTRKATAQAAILTVLPILFVEFERTTGGMNAEEGMRLKNVGSGPAFDIHLDDVTIEFLDIKDRWRLKMNLRPDHLLAGESRLLGRRVTDRQGAIVDQADLMTFTIRNREKKPIKLIIYFRDVTGKRYVTVVDSGKGIARIRKPSTPYGLVRMVKYRLLYPLYGLLGRPIYSMRRWHEMKYHPNIFTHALHGSKKKR